jgi:hypothetical protein
MTPYSVIPYVVAFANEVVHDPVTFVPDAGGLRLAYPDERPEDRVNGVLRVRVQDLRDQVDKRGPERMKTFNTLRQWRAMDNLLCQVCGKPTLDRRTGISPWVLTRTVFKPTGTHSGHTNAPPTCWNCLRIAVIECPMLRDNMSIHTVANATPAGVLAHVFRPGFQHVPVIVNRDVFISWDRHARYHRKTLALTQVFHLQGMTHISLDKALQMAE